MSELRRLIVRHRHVAPMVSALLAGLDVSVTIRDAAGELILERAGATPSVPERFEVNVDGESLGWVEGARAARGIAAVLAYAAARERDKRSLANEALERYRELSLIYELAATIGRHGDLVAIVETALTELGRLPGDARGFLLLAGPDGTLQAGVAGSSWDSELGTGRLGAGIAGAIAASGVPELVEVIADDERATSDEHAAASLVAAPLRADDQPFGVLGALTNAGPFRAADLKVVQAIAALAGPAIGRSIAEAGADTAARPARSGSSS